MVIPKSPARGRKIRKILIPAPEACAVCGKNASSACSGCGSVFYCCEGHQYKHFMEKGHQCPHTLGIASVLDPDTEEITQESRRVAKALIRAYGLEAKKSDEAEASEKTYGIIRGLEDALEFLVASESLSPYIEEVYRLGNAENTLTVRLDPDFDYSRIAGLAGRRYTSGTGAVYPSTSAETKRKKDDFSRARFRDNDDFYDRRKEDGGKEAVEEKHAGPHVKKEPQGDDHGRGVVDTPDPHVKKERDDEESARSASSALKEVLDKGVVTEDGIDVKKANEFMQTSQEEGVFYVNEADKTSEALRALRNLTNVFSPKQATDAIESLTKVLSALPVGEYGVFLNDFKVRNIVHIVMSLHKKGMDIYCHTPRSREAFDSYIKAVEMFTIQGSSIMQGLRAYMAILCGNKLTTTRHGGVAFVLEDAKPVYVTDHKKKGAKIKEISREVDMMYMCLHRIDTTLVLSGVYDAPRFWRRFFRFLTYRMTLDFWTAIDGVYLVAKSFCSIVGAVTLLNLAPSVSSYFGNVTLSTLYYNYLEGLGYGVDKRYALLEDGVSETGVSAAVIEVARKAAEVTASAGSIASHATEVAKNRMEYEGKTALQMTSTIAKFAWRNALSYVLPTSVGSVVSSSLKAVGGDRHVVYVPAAAIELVKKASAGWREIPLKILQWAKDTDNAWKYIMPMGLLASQMWGSGMTMYLGAFAYALSHTVVTTALRTSALYSTSYVYRYFKMKYLIRSAKKTLVEREEMVNNFLTILDGKTGVKEEKGSEKK